MRRETDYRWVNGQMNHTAELEKSPPLLQVTNPHVSYGTNVALTGATLTASAGRICGLAGMSGSGKSTLFRSIINSVSRLAGMAEVTGMDANATWKRGLIGYVVQNEEIDWDFPVSVSQIVMMGRYGFTGSLYRPCAADREAVNKVSELVELADLRHRRIGTLSGGQKKRVFIVHATTQGAPPMLLGGPFAGVDKYSEAMIAELLRRLVAQGTGLVVSTHDPASMGKLCDEVVLLCRRVVYHGDVDEALRLESPIKAFGSSDSEDTVENASDPGETPVIQGGQK